jgi:hypothetical protein
VQHGGKGERRRTYTMQHVHRADESGFVIDPYEKKGVLPRMFPSNRRAGGRRNSSTSAALPNWGIRVSSLVETTTVRASSGSICKGEKQQLMSQLYRTCMLMLM